MAEPIQSPHDALSEDALQGLIDDFVTREGTDYGLHEHSLDDKRATVMRQIARGQAVILFDPESETTTLVRREELTSPRK
jgi:uncharacterized protein YheU (UPF0270 family)